MKKETRDSRALVIVCHPDRKSFNHALANASVTGLQARGFSVNLRDLYAENFDPVISREEFHGGTTQDANVLEHIALLQSANMLVVIHPNCWGSPPAMIKGWMDRVFALNSAYAFEKGTDLGDTPKGLLRLEAAIVFNTSNTTEEREGANFGDPLDRIWKDCLLRYCGVPKVDRRVFRVVATSTAELRSTWLLQARELIEQASSSLGFSE